MSQLTSITSSHAAELSQIYCDMRPPIVRHLNRLVSDPSMSEDLCQETFLRAWRAWDDRQMGHIRPWIYRIATHLAFDHLRRQQRLSFVALSDHLSAEPPSYEDHEAITSVLQQLAPQQRLLLLLDSHGWRDAELAAVAGCSVNAIKKRLYHARGAFRQAYLREECL